MLPSAGARRPGSTPAGGSVFDLAGDQRCAPEHAGEHRQDQQQQAHDDHVLVVIEERPRLLGAAAVCERGVVQFRGVRLRRLLDASGECRSVPGAGIRAARSTKTGASMTSGRQTGRPARSNRSCIGRPVPTKNAPNTTSAATANRSCCGAAARRARSCVRPLQVEQGFDGTLGQVRQGDVLEETSYGTRPGRGCRRWFGPGVGSVVPPWWPTRSARRRRSSAAAVGVDRSASCAWRAARRWRRAP